VRPARWAVRWAALTRDKVHPTATSFWQNREKVRPIAASFWQNREKTRPASPKTPKIGHFCRAGRTFSRFPIRFTPQGELFRADPTRNNQSTRVSGPACTHESTCIVPPRPNRDKVRPACPHSAPRAKKLAQQRPHFDKIAKKLAQQAQKHRKSAIFAEQGELFRASRSVSPRRVNYFAQIQQTTTNPRASPARHARQGANTPATGRRPLVIHRSPPPLEVIHKLTQ